jgi:hypothetical protein
VRCPPHGRFTHWRTLYHYGLKSKLQGKDARLFTILILTKKGEASFLELSGAKAIIRWPTFFGMIHSNMSKDEAHELPEHIVAKTHLQLDQL